MHSVRSIAVVRAGLLPSLIAPDEIRRCQRRLPKLMNVPNEIGNGPEICGCDGLDSDYPLHFGPRNPKSDRMLVFD
jgi:hypothetical protein